MKGASGRSLNQVRGLSFNGAELILAVMVYPGNALQQCPGIWMLRVAEDFVDGCLLDDTAGIHYVDPVSILGHNAHIMGD